MASELKIFGQAKVLNRRVELFSSGGRTFEWIGLSESEEAAEQAAMESFSIALRAIDRTYGIPRDGAELDTKYILSSLKPTRAEHVVDTDEDYIWCFGYSLPLDLFHFPQTVPISNDLARDLLLDLALSDPELHGAIVSDSNLTIDRADEQEDVVDDHLVNFYASIGANPLGQAFCHPVYQVVSRVIYIRAVDTFEYDDRGVCLKDFPLSLQIQSATLRAAVKAAGVRLPLRVIAWLRSDGFEDLAEQLAQASATQIVQKDFNVSA